MTVDGGCVGDAEAGTARSEGAAGTLCRSRCSGGRYRDLVLRSAPSGSVLRAPDGAAHCLYSGADAINRAVDFPAFLIPGVVYGYVAGTVQSHRDIIKGMSKR